jgi:hypothetical protein
MDLAIMTLTQTYLYLRTAHSTGPEANGCDEFVHLSQVETVLAHLRWEFYLGCKLVATEDAAGAVLCESFQNERLCGSVIIQNKFRS